MGNEKLIENYFANSLSSEELLKFNELYKKDKVFKENIDFLKNLKLITKKEESENFRTQLKSFEKEASSKEVNKPKKWFKPLPVIAAMLIITLSISYLLNTSVNETELFNDYFEPSKNVSLPIVRSENIEDIQNNAMIAYIENNYEKANLLFEDAYSNNRNSELLFYQGNALLASGKIEEAIQKFKTHLKTTDTLTQRSHWYLALAYLKNKDLKQARQQLEFLLNSGEIFKEEEASSLLKKLK